MAIISYCQLLREESEIPRYSFAALLLNRAVHFGQNVLPITAGPLMNDQPEMSELADVPFGSFLGCVPLPRQHSSSRGNTLGTITQTGRHVCAYVDRSPEILD